LVGFLLGLPLVLFQVCGAATPFFCSALAFMALGIDESGAQIEQPFCILPLLPLCNAVQAEVEAMRKMLNERQPN